MGGLNPFGAVTGADIAAAAREYGAPLYLYDEATIVAQCGAMLSMPNAYGLTVRYAMKANSSRALLQLINQQGLQIDASSLMEVRRANLAGVPLDNIMLTTQEVQRGEDEQELQRMMLQGLKFNVCSLLQLRRIAPFAQQQGIDLSIRLHPGVGSGESASRNTGDHYSCFGVHLSDLERAQALAQEFGLRFTQVHVHIGSGGDPQKWQENIDRELELLERHFAEARSVSFGGGLKVARMPGELEADVEQLGLYAKQRIQEFYHRTSRKLRMEVEPGTFIVAGSGYILTEVLDKKSTGDQGFQFIVAGGGMELNARPLLYGSQHPFYIVSPEGELRWSEFGDMPTNGYEAIVVGHCCESGDAQSLDDSGRALPRPMREPEVGDLLVIGGAGAYCASMAPFNYNSHLQAPEVLLQQDGRLRLIRRRQSLLQLVENEL